MSSAFSPRGEALLDHVLGGDAGVVGPGSHSAARPRIRSKRISSLE